MCEKKVEMGGEMEGEKVEHPLMNPLVILIALLSLCFVALSTLLRIIKLKSIIFDCLTDSGISF